LEQKLTDIEEEITSVFGSMKQNPYYLHAILVHEGDSESGHYYAFIFDRNEFKWYRFNDYRVTPETEDKVFEESFGGNGKKSCAYGLIYVNNDIAIQQNQMSLLEYNKQLESLVPKVFIPDMKIDNYKFTDEVTKYQVDKIVKNIITKYKQRSEKIN
jgi:ubiquitin carboxyl-terminal hydrolase 25/28